MPFKIRRWFNFDAAHKLPNHPGKCANLHGHRWKGFVELAAMSLMPNGMVMDFKDLDQKIQKCISVYDHSFLNDRVANPTAEIMAREIYHAVKKEVDNVVMVGLAESEDSYAYYWE